jgi:hypothetical protein
MNKPKKFPRFNWDEITHAGDFTLTNKRHDYRHADYVHL